MRFTLRFIVMGHLETRPPETALDVEALVGFAAVEDALVAAGFLGDEVEGLDESETEFLALLVFCDGDVFDMANGAKVVDAITRCQLGRTRVDDW